MRQAGLFTTRARATSSRGPRQLIAFVAAVLVVALLPLGLRVWGSSAPSAAGVLGQPDSAMTLAVVRMGGTTAYFPGVTCFSPDPTVIRVQLGDWPTLNYEPIYFFLAASLDGSWVTAMAGGGRPGFTFDQAGEGSMATDPTLVRQMQRDRPSDEVQLGSLTFSGVDRTDVAFTGTVRCSA